LYIPEIGLHIHLYICIAAVIAWIAVIAVFAVKISGAKKTLVQEGRSIPSSDKKLVPSVIASFVLIALPFLVFFKPYITAVLELCGVLGAYIVLQDRLEQLKR